MANIPRQPRLPYTPVVFSGVDVTAHSATTPHAGPVLDFEAYPHGEAIPWWAHGRVKHTQHWTKENRASTTCEPLPPQPWREPR